VKLIWIVCSLLVAAVVLAVSLRQRSDTATLYSLMLKSFVLGAIIGALITFFGGESIFGIVSFR
jgi:uncharacterized membrane protein YoaK (UPF0700 family)